jgi:hypothetical protein
MQRMNSNELDWLWFGKIRLQVFHYSQRVFRLSCLIVMVEGLPKLICPWPQKTLRRCCLTCCVRRVYYIAIEHTSRVGSGIIEVCKRGKCPPENFLRDKGIISPPPPPDNPTVQIAPFVNELLWLLFNNIGT